MPTPIFFPDLALRIEERERLNARWPRSERPPPPPCRRRRPGSDETGTRSGPTRILISPIRSDPKRARLAPPRQVQFCLPCPSCATSGPAWGFVRTVVRSGGWPHRQRRPAATHARRGSRGEWDCGIAGFFWAASSVLVVGRRRWCCASQQTANDGAEAAWGFIRLSYPRTAASRGARRTGSRRGGSRVQSPACFVRAEKAPSAMSGGCGDSMGSMERRARGVWRHDETWSSFRSHRCQESCKSRPEP